MKRFVVKEEEITFAKLIDECNNEDINVADILEAIDSKFENYRTNVEMINKSIRLLLNCRPCKEEISGIDMENVKQLLDILE